MVGSVHQHVDAGVSETAFVAGGVIEDASIWDGAYRAYAPSLLRYLRRLTPTNEVAEELMQETFTRAMRAARVPRAAHEIRPWLYRIATNIAVDRLRRERRFSFVPFLGREIAPEPDAEQVDLVRRALRAIPSDQAVAIVLRLHEGFTPAEIAELLEVTEVAVKSRLFRGRRAFIAAFRRSGGHL